MIKLAMKSITRFSNITLSILFLLSTLVNCGGSSGGGSSNGDNVDDTTQETIETIEPGAVTANTTTIYLEALRNSSDYPASTVQITYTGSVPALIGTRYPGGVKTDKWFSVFKQTTNNPYTFSIEINDTSLDTGTYTSSIYLGAIRADDSLIIDYETIDIIYVVKSSIVATPQQIDFIPGKTPMKVDINLDTTLTTRTWTSSINYLAGSDWLEMSAVAGDQIPTSLSVNALPMMEGNYQAIISLSTDPGSDVLKIPVSYTVEPARSDPRQLGWTIDGGTDALQLRQKMTLTAPFFSQSRSADPTWSISSTADWLSFSVTESVRSQGVEFEVDIVNSALEFLAPGTHFSEIRVVSLGVDELLVPVMLDVNMPLVQFVSPYVATSNTQGDVIVRGKGFNFITNHPINIGDIPATQYNLVSDTEFRISHTALAAGNYPVSMPNGLGLKRSGAELVVLDPPNYEPAEIAARTGYFAARPVYDAERQSLYIDDGNDGEIERYRFDGTTWLTESTKMDFIKSMTLSPDGKLILAIVINDIVYINPVDFTIIDRFTLNDILISRYASYIAFGNDGKAVVLVDRHQSPVFLFDPAMKTFEPIAYDVSLYNPRLAASSDKSRIAIFNRENENAIYYYDTSSSSIVKTETLIAQATAGSYDRHGKNLLFQGYSLYDENFIKLGEIPIAVFGTLSKDGQTIYGINRGYNIPPGPGNLIRVYDVNQIDATGLFVEITNTAGFTVAPENAGNTTLTHDGGNIFTVGSNVTVGKIP